MPTPAARAAEIVGGNTDIGLSYEGKFKSHYTDRTGLINVKYNF